MDPGQEHVDPDVDGRVGTAALGSPGGDPCNDPLPLGQAVTLEWAPTVSLDGGREGDKYIKLKHMK